MFPASYYVDSMFLGPMQPFAVFWHHVFREVFLAKTLSNPLQYPIMLTTFFGADEIPMHTIDNVHAAIPDIIVWAAPAMFFFVLLEYIISRWQNRKYYNNSKETLGSTLVGLGNVAIGLVLKTALLYLFVIIYNAIPWRMELSWWTFIPCYIIFDFSNCGHTMYRTGCGFSGPHT